MNQRGTALIGVVLIASAASTIAVVATLGAGAAAQELRDRRAVLCARYAARGGAILGRKADGRPDLITASLTALSVVVEERTPHSCLVISTARCDHAVRRIELRLWRDRRCE